MTEELVQNPGRFLVRLLTSSCTAAGVGVLVGQNEVMTCAHVVNSAMGLPPRSQDHPDGAVAIEFPLLAGDGGEVPRCHARVTSWLPPPRDGAVGDDLAGLVITDGSVPARAAPAQLAGSTPRAGLIVDVFGYPGLPPRPDGAWVEAVVRGEVGGGRMQLDGTTGTALRIQPGYSGSPLCDRATGRVVGLLSAAPRADTGDRDSYAISSDRLVLAWQAVLGATALANPRAGATRRHSSSELTVLHMSDPQFGENHLFGGNGLTPAEPTHDILFRYLHDDLATIADEHGLRPDLMIVTGDLTEWGLPSEFDQALEFLAALADATGLPRRHVAIVPGNHDVNRKACQAYFTSQAADQQEPARPYWPKWRHFAAALNRFYDGVEGVSFTPDEPWTLLEMPELAVVVAGLNSTMAESHLDSDHYGRVGEEQARWFAERLSGYRRRGWLRLAAVHHNVVHGAALDEENLRDADDLDRWLGKPSPVNLLMHGHTHNSQVHRMPSGLVVLSTGSAAVTAEGRPQEVPNQYQLISIRRDGLIRHARQYSVEQRCWIGDTRVSRTGSDWRDRYDHQFDNVGETFTEGKDDRVARRDPDISARASRAADGRDDDFLDRVQDATRAKYPDATITVRRDGGYLRVSRRLPGGGFEQWPIGVADSEMTHERLQVFAERVHSRFAAADPQVRSELVYAGSPAGDSLAATANRLGVRLRSFVDYLELIDLRALVNLQESHLAADRRYPEELYISQRYQLFDASPGVAAEGLLDQVITWLATDGAQFVMVLGDFGRGKTFMLRQLVRRLPGRLPGLLPVLVELRGLEKAPSLDELLAQHLVRHGMETVELGKLRHMVRS
jgi:3',5'-cyclic AMP phosphodiesterase CpdA